MQLLLLLLTICATAVAHAASAPSPSHRIISGTAGREASVPTAPSTLATTPELPLDVASAAQRNRRATTAAVKTVTVAAVLPSTAPEYSSYSLFTSAVLNSTNLFRREHNATVAVWNTTLAQYADDYLANNKNCTFAHSGGPYGENLAVGYTSVHGAVDGWGNERSEYSFRHPGFTEQTGHFSQLVWKTSVTVGCGRRLCGGKAHGEESTGWFLVCEYWPRGNIIGQFADEVQRQVLEVATNSSSSTNGTVDLTPVGGYGNRPSSGVIVGAMVILCIITAAFVIDVRVNIKDEG